MKDQTWGAIAWWVVTILKWTVWIVLILGVLQLVFSYVGGHSIWVF